ncbi:hypothetical protein CfE428DRAFT_5810 [Chthoniobacter flavus Ellin428]|uniref:Uncharacterized protein n=1 Tax=Chthoniobacter flavus Ellin428 TaxID=497964 RepID=B4DA70_9BACT|nr:hypothetical protein [Chthoniobacter flavus]EDY16697.1 hypothetical protein CfE428DRAFT_5810 [Chthoniobacter flavus Ellin428]
MISLLLFVLLSLSGPFSRAIAAGDGGFLGGNLPSWLPFVAIPSQEISHGTTAGYHTLSLSNGIHTNPAWLSTLNSQLSTFAPLLANDLPDPSPKDFMIWLGCGLLLVTIAGAVLWTWNQAREAFGRKPTGDEEIAEIKRKMVTSEALDLRLHGVATKEELQAAEMRIEHALHSQFQSLDQKRSVSIGNLHEKVETTADGLRHEVNQVRTMIAEMPGKIAEIMRVGRSR